VANPQAEADAKFVEAWGQARDAGLSARKFAKEIGQSASALFARRRRVEARLGIKLPQLTEGGGYCEARDAIRGWSPDHDMTHTVPEGYAVKGVSTLYDGDGKVRAQWVKSKQDSEIQREMLEAAMLAFADKIPKAKVGAPAKRGNADLLNCFVVTDFHMGALSWEPETGADWDIAIAERALVEWFRQVISQVPAAETAVLAQLSDLLHWDGMDAVTPASKHLLDADTRFQKLVRCAIRVLRQVIGMLLERHAKLHIIMADANHDPVSQVWLREWLSVYYEDDARVTVDTSPSPYNAYEFGNVALFFHHGHRRKVSNVSEVFAGKFRELFGRTKYAYAHMGHLHHVDVKEDNLMIVEQHRTLAAPDAYAARGGWLSGRDAKAITYSREFGEVGRTTVSYDMIKNVSEPAHDRTPPESSRRAGKRAAR
jgi:hypothetical protein